MADQDLKDIFDQAIGPPDKIDQLKNDDQNIKDIFQQAHDKDDISQVASDETKQPSKLSAYGTMAAKGATAGLTGAAAGVGAALGTATGGKPDWQSMKKAYQEALQQQKDKEEAAKQQTGLPGKAVELAAGIPSMLVGGAALKGAGLTAPIVNAAGVGAGTGLANYIGQTPAPTASGAATATGIGAGLGTVGGAIGQKVGNVLNPESLDVSASKMAQEAMGMNSAKDLTSQYNPMTQQVERGSDIIKGTGTTALDQGVLKGGPSKWYDNALQALQSNSSKLSPLLNSTQQKLDANLPSVMEDVGAITTKTPDVMQSIFDSVPQTSQRNVIIKKITQQYQNYEQKLGQADGNLPALNAIKQELQTAAQNISPQIYTNGSAKVEADLYKRLGGVVRQHIEDLASAADPGAGDTIHTINQNTSNIMSMLPSLQKTTRGGIPTNLSDIAQKVVGPAEAFAAKGISAAANPSVQNVAQQAPNALISNPETQEKVQSKVIDTPAAPLEQEPMKVVSEKTVNNPFSQQTIQSARNPSKPIQATATASSLYNATDDSLKQVASTFNKTPGLQFYADHLNKAIDTDDQAEKNRAIFLILQNPIARKLVMPESKK